MISASWWSSCHAKTTTGTPYSLVFPVASGVFEIGHLPHACEYLGCVRAVTTPDKNVFPFLASGSQGVNFEGRLGVYSLAQNTLTKVCAQWRGGSSSGRTGADSVVCVFMPLLQTCGIRANSTTSAPTWYVDLPPEVCNAVAAFAVDESSSGAVFVVTRGTNGGAPTVMSTLFQVRVWHQSEGGRVGWVGVGGWGSLAWVIPSFAPLAPMHGWTQLDGTSTQVSAFTTPDNTQLGAAYVGYLTPQSSNTTFVGSTVGGLVLWDSGNGVVKSYSDLQRAGSSVLQYSYLASEDSLALLFTNTTGSFMGFAAPGAQSFQVREPGSEPSEERHPTPCTQVAS